jgi:hypothetical protein
VPGEATLAPQSCRPRWPPAARLHLVLKQANYDLGKQQFNTVASGAMKMLNALEKAPREGALAAEVIAEGCRSCCACCRRSARTSRMCCGATAASATTS